MYSKFLSSLIWLIAMGWSQSGQTNSRMCTYRVAGVMTTICWQVYAHLKNEATVLEVKFRPGGEYSMVLTFDRGGAGTSRLNDAQNFQSFEAIEVARVNIFPEREEPRWRVREVAK